MVAPAVEGQFGPDITPDSWRIALKKAGFEDMIEVSLGGDMTAAAEAAEWAEAFEKGESKTTSCCPAFVNMIRKHFPELSDRISTSVSPMCAVSRLIKSRDPEAVTVFIGPCQAKKSEALDITISDNADYVLTFDEAVEMLLSNGFRKSKIVGESYTPTSKYAFFVSPSGFVIDLIKHIKKEDQ